MHCRFPILCLGGAQASVLLRYVLRATARVALVAQCALMERSFPSAFSFQVVSSTSVCVVHCVPHMTQHIRNGSRTVLLRFHHSSQSLHMVAELMF